MSKPVNIVVDNKMAEHFLKVDSRCVCCGAEVPEGWMVCPDCMQNNQENVTHKTDNKTRRDCSDGRYENA